MIMVNGQVHFEEPRCKTSKTENMACFERLFLSGEKLYQDKNRSRTFFKTSVAPLTIKIDVIACEEKKQLAG